MQPASCSPLTPFLTVLPLHCHTLDFQPPPPLLQYFTNEEYELEGFDHATRQYQVCPHTP